MSKGRVLFRIVVGGYLAYMGFSWPEEPSLRDRRTISYIR